MVARRIFFAMSLAGIFIFAVSTSGQEPAVSTRQIEIIQSGTVHVFPSNLYDTLGGVSPGERYTVLARSGPDWYKIDFRGQVGYIPKEITKLLPREKLVQPKVPPRPAVTGVQPAPAKPQDAKALAAKSARTAAPVAKKMAEPGVEPEMTQPVDTLSTVQVSSEAAPIEVTAQSGSHATLWLLLGGLIFLVIVVVLVYFLRPEESAEEFLHHRTS